MSKRMTETGKWQDRWFRSLSPELKCLWTYLCDNCDQAGVIEPDYDLIEFVIGRKIEWPAVALAFHGKVIELSKHRWWLPKYIKFQHGKLSHDCKPHQHVITLLEKHKLTARYQELEESGYISLEATQTLLTLSDTPKGSDNRLQRQPDGSTGQPTGKQRRTSDKFDAFWEAYPKCERKTDKKKCLNHWAVHGLDGLWPDIEKGLSTWKQSDTWNKDDGEYIPMPFTWLNNRRWEDTESIAAPVTPKKAVEDKRVADGRKEFERDLALKDCIEALWRVNGNDAEFKAQLAVLNNKFPRREYGLNKDGQSLIEEALDIVAFRKKRETK